MSGPSLRVDLSPDAYDFRPEMVSSGLPLVDRWASGGGLICDWLGRFAAEPVWDGDTIEYYVTDGDGGRLVDVDLIPATPEDLRGRLKGELAALREKLQQAVPKSASGQTIHQYVGSQLAENGAEQRKHQWFQYRASSGAWQLVWCAGYIPTRERLLARSVICSNKQCRQLTLVNPRETVTCWRCGDSVPPRTARLGTMVRLMAMLLLLAGLVVGGLWWYRPVVAGQVVRAWDGQAIPAARVMVGADNTEIVADAQGSFRHEFFPRVVGSVTLQVIAPGFRDHPIQAELQLSRETRIEVPMQGAGGLEGQVVCVVGSDRLPVAAAETRIVGASQAAVETDQEGRFRWDSLPPGPLEIEVSAPGYISHSAQAQVGDASPALDIVLIGDRTLEGRVVHAIENSQPISGAEVRWTGSETPAAITDDTGRFTLTALPPMPVRIQAAAKGFQTQTLSVPPDAPSPTIPLTGDATIRGMVLRGDNEQPAVRAEVTVEGTPWRAVTDSEGRFRCTGVRSGSVTLMATMPGMSALIPTDLAANDETEVRIVLAGNAVLRGRVLESESGQPVPDATVTVPETRLSAAADQDGHFTLTQLPAGEVPLRISADGFVTTDLNYRLDDGEQSMEDIELTPIIDLQGLVVRAVDGEPIAGANIAIADPRIIDKSRHDGRFRLPDVPRTSARLGVMADGYAQQVLTIEPDEHELRIELLGSAALRGRIVNEVDKQAIAEATIVVDRSPWHARSDEAGQFVLDGVVAAPATLHLAAAGFADRSVNVPLKPGPQDLGELTLSPLPAAEDSGISFFGIETPARSIGFVVDRSGSMGHSRMERAKTELIESILQLAPEQRFYVTFFSDDQYPMSEPPRDLVPASLEEKTRLFQWMNTIHAGGGTQPEPSLLMIAEMKPEAIFLLSDGVFAPLRPSTFELLANEQIVVHTIALEDPSGAVMLEQIADRTGGTYRFIPEDEHSQDFELTMVEWLTGHLTMGSPDAARPFHATLRELSGGQDFGCPEDATPEERAACADRWNQWWRTHLAERRQAESEERQRLEEIARKEREAEAAERARLEMLDGQQREAADAERRHNQQRLTSDEALRLARLLQHEFEKSDRWNEPEMRDRVLRRLNSIIQDFPESRAAEEAKQLLQQWQ
jgi:hypothetical protein